MNALLGLISCFSFLMILVLCSYQLRQRKYRQVADQLGAQYHSQGLFRSGTITGISNQKNYTVSTVDRGRAGTWTTVTMQCVNKGIPISVHGHFFNPFPNWKYAFTLGERTERVFFAHLTLQNVGVPLEEKYRDQVQGLFQEFALNYDVLRKGHLVIADDSIAFTISGAVRKFDTLKQILFVLTGLADRIEASPIV